MAEALACGTPVIGLRRGSVPEVVEHGKTGFVCDDLEAMERAVQQLPSLSRAAARRAAEERFSSGVLVQQYLTLYEQLAAAVRA
jgi:glycosyltransferase involved in cell wall biosynthesis